MIVLIPLETASRELAYKVYLCNKLALNGFKCYLGDKSSIHYLTNNFKKYIYLDKGYHEDVSEEIYRNIKKNKGIIINLDEEGGVDFKDNTIIKSRYSSKMQSLVDKVLLWGTNQFKTISNALTPKNRLTVTGHPRFELLKKEFHFLYEKEKKSIQKKHGSFILVNTNMGFGNNIRGDDFVIKNYQKRLI